MGSRVPRERTLTTAASLSAGPEALARLVLRCRELSSFLETALPQLPARDETPFLYGQLDDVLQRLQSGLRQLVAEEPGQGEKASFLRRLAGRKPREEKKKSEPLYDLQGNAWTIPVTELVGFLAHAGKSGLLWITSPVETFVLEFSRGCLVHATSSAPPAAFRLGEILLSEKMLAPEELTQVIDLAKAADDLLGSYLLRTGRLRHGDLQRALAIQVQELFHRLMDADNALYRFQEGAQLLRSQSLEVNITHLLLESARKKDEARLKAERLKAAEAAKDAPPPAPKEVPKAAISREAPPPKEPPKEAAKEPPKPAAAAPKAAESSSVATTAVATEQEATGATDEELERGKATDEELERRKATAAASGLASAGRGPGLASEPGAPLPKTDGESTSETASKPSGG